jgi:hypothetical protein
VQRPRLQGQSLGPELVLVPERAEEQEPGPELELELEAALAAEQEVVVEEQAV